MAEGQIKITKGRGLSNISEHLLRGDSFWTTGRSFANFKAVVGKRGESGGKQKGKGP